MRETRQKTRERAKVRGELRKRLEGENDPTVTSKVCDNGIDKLSGDTTRVGGPFRLFDLPVELQTMIYEYAVAESEKVLILENVRTPALARTNRRLRRMVVPIFLGVNTFRLFTEETISNCTKANDLTFKIRHETLEWLRQLGEKTPLFKSLIIHFGPQCQTELRIKRDGHNGIIVTHEQDCLFCHPCHATYPPLPSSILPKLARYEVLSQIIRLNEKRYRDYAAGHAKAIADIEAELFGKFGGMKKTALAMSVTDVLSLERVLSYGSTLMAVAVHTKIMVSINELPLTVKYHDKIYSLRSDVVANGIEGPGKSIN